VVAARGNKLQYISFEDGWVPELGPLPYTLPPSRGTTPNQCPFCANTMVPIETQTSGRRETRTLKCQTCDESFLQVSRGNALALVNLPRVLEARAEQPEKRPAVQFSLPHDDFLDQAKNDQRPRVDQRQTTKLTLDDF
jgi:hypothetical protein